VRHVHRSISLTDRSSVGEARRAAVNVALALGFEEEWRNDIGIAATEVANNVVLHAKGGELLICSQGREGSFLLDLMAIDNGPGISNVSRAMEDGFSTTGTPGQGLGAIGRLSDSSSLYSIPEKGTIYWCRFSPRKGALTCPVGVVTVPFKGETTSGDGYFTLLGETRSLYMVVDGLGHGVGASEAANEALAVVEASAQETATEIVERTHDALKKTRGAAMSVAIIDHDRKILTYAGVGNIGATLSSGDTNRSLISQNGTLGAVLPRLQSYTYPIERNTLLIMFSDGLASKTGLSTYTGLQVRHPALIAGVLYRDFSRKRDDATVLVARMEEERG
jgi:anti-sigma regulatory factor (Ser/Thr protein kinase)